MTEKHGKDAPGFAFEGKANPAFHHEGVYGTHEGDKKEGSHAPDLTVRGMGDRALRDKQEKDADKAADDFLRSHGLDPDKL